MDSVYDIREPRDQRLFDSFPGLFAAFHALHRLLAPRHPPHALSNLTTMILVSIEHDQTAFRQTVASQAFAGRAPLFQVALHRNLLPDLPQNMPRIAPRHLTTLGPPSP
jgi:hypothetical protein